MRRNIAREFADMPDDEAIVAEQLVDGDRVITLSSGKTGNVVPIMGVIGTGITEDNLAHDLVMDPAWRPFF